MSENNLQGQKSPLKRFFSGLNPKKLFSKEFYTKKNIIILVAVVLIIALLCFFVFGKGKNNKTEEQKYTEAQAERMDITETIEQSGVIEPLDRYEITSLVKGEIISSPYEEGDYVEEGATLYQIDDEDAQLNIEKTQNSIERSRMSLEETSDDISKLNIYANASGKLSEFTMKMGDTVNGVIGKITNTDNLTVDIPFSAADFDKISVGNSVTITSALYMTSMSGRVSHKYDATAGTGNDGSVLKNIEIEIPNPGSLAEGTTFAATVNTPYGTVSSAGSGTIGGGTVTTLKADVSGTVSYIAVKDGDYVKKGQLIAKLTSDSLTNSQRSGQLNLKDSELSLKSSQKSLDDYNITSPISGTVITKNSKAGDKIDNSNSQTVMMVVADMSKVKFTITVDELDITKIALGQTAVVDADALPEETYEAKVTSIAGEGTSTGDGVTTFKVELTIDEPGNLRSGMNVNANIVIEEAKDVIGIPEEALMNTKGSTAKVLVKSDKAASKNDKRNAEGGDADKAKGKSASAGSIPANADAKSGSNKGTNSAPTGDSGKGSGGAPAGGNAVPDGYEMRDITVGISDGTNIEVVSGLSEGETIIYIPKSGESDNPFAMMMGGGMGGRPDGGQGGGPGGGAPGGGGPGGR